MHHAINSIIFISFQKPKPDTVHQILTEFISQLGASFAREMEELLTNVEFTKSDQKRSSKNTTQNYFRNNNKYNKRKVTNEIKNT